MASSDTLNSYLDTINQFSEASKNIGAGREEGVNKLKTQYGYDDKLKNLEAISKQVMDTEGILDNVDEDIGQRTAGRLVTNAQRNAIAGNAKVPLAKTLANLSRTQTAGQGDLDRVLGMVRDWTNTYNADATTKLGGLKDTASLLFGKYQAEDKAETQAREDAWRKEQTAFENSLKQQQLALQRAQTNAQIAAANKKSATPNIDEAAFSRLYDATLSTDPAKAAKMFQLYKSGGMSAVNDYLNKAPDNAPQVKPADTGMFGTGSSDGSFLGWDGNKVNNALNKYNNKNQNVFQNTWDFWGGLFGG